MSQKTPSTKTPTPPPTEKVEAPKPEALTEADLNGVAGGIFVSPINPNPQG